MIISFTGIVYTFLTLGLAIISYRFFLYWRKEKEIISEFLFFAFVILTIVCGAGMVVGVFFAESPEAIKMVVIYTSFLAALANAFFAYLTLYIRFPRISPWWGFGGILLFGIIVSFLTIIVPLNPHLEPTGGLNWGIPLSIGILRALFYFLGCFPLFLVTFGEWRRARERSLKIKSLLVSMFLLLGVSVPIVDFVLEPALKLQALISEVMIIFVAGVAILIYFASIKLRPPKYVKKID